MNRKKFDNVERQIRDIGLKYWKNLNGLMIRSAATELRRGALVLFGNKNGNMYIRKEWTNPLWWKSIVPKNAIGLYFDPNCNIVVELNLTEVEILEKEWRNK
jgi:hypothetical protein